MKAPTKERLRVWIEVLVQAKNGADLTGVITYRQFDGMLRARMLRGPHHRARLTELGRLVVRAFELGQAQGGSKVLERVARSFERGEE